MTLTNWNNFLRVYRAKHPNLTYKQAQKQASVEYSCKQTRGSGNKGSKPSSSSSLNDDLQSLVDRRDHLLTKKGVDEFLKKFFSNPLKMINFTKNQEKAIDMFRAEVTGLNDEIERKKLELGITWDSSEDTNPRSGLRHDALQASLRDTLPTQDIQNLIYDYDDQNPLHSKVPELLDAKAELTEKRRYLETDAGQRAFKKQWMKDNRQDDRMMNDGEWGEMMHGRFLKDYYKAINSSDSEIHEVNQQIGQWSQLNEKNMHYEDEKKDDESETKGNGMGRPELIYYPPGIVGTGRGYKEFHVSADWYKHAKVIR